VGLSLWRRSAKPAENGAQAFRPGAHEPALPQDGRVLFGNLAHQVMQVPKDQLEACLEHQRQWGGRLGDILCKRELLTREQILELLRLQGRHIGRSLMADPAACDFPYPTFLSLCLPAYNEAENIEDTLDAACAILPQFVERFEIVVVDDGSKDDTAERVARYGQREPRVRLVRHEQNRGYGAAVTTALRAAEGDHIAFTDSDGQFSLLDLPQLLVRLKQYDIIVGYRYRRADPWHRKMNAWAWGRLIRFLLGVRVRDLDCAFKIFPREVVQALSLTATGAGINAEILAQCVRSGLTIGETPVNHYPRYHGAPTGAALRVIFKAFRELPRMLKYRFGPSPKVASKPEAPPPPPAAPSPKPADDRDLAGTLSR
jgi:hypothetical protein